MRVRVLLIGAILVLVLAVFFLRADKRDVTLFFTDLEVLELSDCSAVLPTTRSFRASNVTPDSVLRELLKGPNLKERTEQGMASMYLGLPGRDDVGELQTYYRGITSSGTIAIVDFAPEALAYLNAAACIQAAVKAPIEWTLLEFPDIMHVQYSIDGEVFEEWDA